MDLNRYQIIVGPVMSDKAHKLNQTMNKLVLKVHPKANKAMVAEAVRKLFNVKVKNVNIVVRKGKQKKVQRKKITNPTTKKAIVTLAEGHKLDLLNQTDAQFAVK